VPPTLCPRVPLAVPPVGPFRRTPAPTAPRPAALAGRTLAAALVTLREAEATWLFAGPGLKFLPAVITGGLAARGPATFVLQEYCDTLGVNLSGTVVVELAGDAPATPLRVRSAALTIGGTAAARGTLHIQGGRVTGRLGGRDVAARF